MVGGEAGQVNGKQTGSGAGEKCCENPQAPRKRVVPLTAQVAKGAAGSHSWLSKRARISRSASSSTRWQELNWRLQTSQTASAMGVSLRMRRVRPGMAHHAITPALLLDISSYQ